MENHFVFFLEPLAWGGRFFFFFCLAEKGVHLHAVGFPRAHWLIDLGLCPFRIWIACRVSGTALVSLVLSRHPGPASVRLLGSWISCCFFGGGWVGGGGGRGEGGLGCPSEREEMDYGLDVGATITVDLVNSIWKAKEQNRRREKPKWIRFKKFSALKIDMETKVNVQSPKEIPRFLSRWWFYDGL